MEEPIETMNNTLAMISEFTEKPKTQRLLTALEKVVDNGDYSCGHVMAALVQLLITEHILTATNDDGMTCKICTNESLTELLQTIRTLHSDIIDSDAASCNHDDGE